MSVRRPPSLPLTVRSTLLVGLALGGVFALSHGYSEGLLERSFRELEVVEAAGQARLADVLFSQQAGALQGNTGDYAQWDEAFEYLGGRRPDFLGVNFTIEQFAHIDIDVVVLFEFTGRPVFHGRRPGAGDLLVTRDDGLASLSAEELAAWARVPGLLGLRRAEQVVSGAVVLEGTPLLVAASPVLTSAGEGPARGVLVMAKVLDASRLEALGTVASARLSPVFPAPPPVGPSFAGTTSTQVLRLAGLLGGPSLGLVVEGHRRALAQLEASREVLRANLILLGLACLFVVALVMHRTVLRRITDFSRRARSMRQERGLAALLPVRGDDELDRLAVAMNELLGELRETQDRLREDALRDALTGLGNRTALEQRLSFLDALMARDPALTYCVFLLDLDGFKKVNDVHGHQAGDHVLQVVGKRIRREVRESDLVARIGGDEFVAVVVPAPPEDQRAALGARLAEAAREPVAWEGAELRVSASIGIVTGGGERHGRASDLLRDADIAMYAAKEAGRDRTTHFLPALRERLQERLELEQELRDGIAAGELEVWFQPIVNGRTGRVVAAESLVRWRSARRGLVLPDQFVPIAEDTHLIVALDRAVLQQAIEGLERLRRVEPSLSMSVNLSVLQLLQPDVAAFISRALADRGIPPNALALEITETGFARDEARLLPAVMPLVEAGVKLHLDDFGVGYSSLNRLLQLPVHALKIDRSFVSRMDAGYGDIVEAMVKIGHAIGKEIVAEGVESAHEYQRLAALGCEYMQGHYFAKPMPEAEFATYLARGRRWPSVA